MNRKTQKHVCAAFLVFFASAILGASSWPALEEAADALAAGRLAAARDSFRTVAADGSAPPFVRGIAMLGDARAALALGDEAAAIDAWKRLAADAALPGSHRDTARRSIAEAERVSRGLPARDPAAYRAELPALPEPALVLAVSPGTGATLEAAREAIRAARASNGGKLPKGGARIAIAGGTYLVREPFRLTAEDSGTAEAPIVYQAKPGETPVFSGGVAIATWKPISDEKLRERLDPSVRDRVLEADLAALGVKDLGDATGLRVRPELFLAGVPQTLARWPHEGFVVTGETSRDAKGPAFRYLEDRPDLWVDEPDVRLHGYFFWDWFDDYQKVAAIDAGARTFTLAPPYANYGYKKGQRYYALNVFREIDRPGEWYLDRRTSMIYWLPPEGAAPPPNLSATLSVHAKPFIEFAGVEHVIVQGLVFQEGRGDGVHIRGGSNCLVAGCTLRRLGGDAIVIEGGRRHGIFGCAMETLGCGGARVAGGDRKAFEPGSHFIENSTVSSIARIKRTYAPAVHLDGCGNRIAHNLFERIASSAMRIEGNDHVIELNAIRRVVEESDDQGGLDMFGNPLYRGVVIRWNRWSDIAGGTHCGAAGVRLDDMISGVMVHGNIFERCGAVLFGGVQIHGGKDNLVDANYFVDCFAGISFSRWGDKRWLDAIRSFENEANEPSAAARYPELARLKVEADINYISRNIFARTKTTFLRGGGERVALNATTDQPIEWKAISSATAFRSDPLLRRALFEPIPIDEIGPYEHPWRARGSP